MGHSRRTSQYILLSEATAKYTKKSKIYFQIWNFNNLKYQHEMSTILWHFQRAFQWYQIPLVSAKFASFKASVGPSTSQTGAKFHIFAKLWAQESLKVRPIIIFLRKSCKGAAWKQLCNCWPIRLIVLEKTSRNQKKCTGARTEGRKNTRTHTKRGPSQ